MNTLPLSAKPSNTRNTNIGPVCLVTGGAGFLGRALVKALIIRGYKVHALDRIPGFDTHDALTTITGDIRDYNTVKSAAKGCATVFHTAAVMNFLGVCSRKIWREVRSINVDGTHNVIRACKELGIPRLVYTSTDSVCYSKRPLANGDESLPYPKSCLDIYAKTKIMAEKAVHEANGQEGLLTVSLRPAGLWGADRGCYMVSKLVNELQRGTFVATVGDGKSLADNTHIDNLVQAELLAAEKLMEAPTIVAGQAYFITDEEPMNLIEWFRPLIEGLGFTVPRRSIPAWLMYSLAFLMEYFHRVGGPNPFMTRLEVHNLTSSFTFKCDKARRELGYRPTIGQIQGMKQCVDYYRETCTAQRKKYE